MTTPPRMMVSVHWVATPLLWRDGMVAWYESVTVHCDPAAGGVPIPSELGGSSAVALPPGGGAMLITVWPFAPVVTWALWQVAWLRSARKMVSGEEVELPVAELVVDVVDAVTW